MDAEADARKTLRAATEALYTAFAHYPLRPIVYGCTHCVSAEDNARIHSKPLRELSWDDLQRYAHKAMTTWGDADDYKHFLPRIFELRAWQNGGSTPLDIEIYKLQDADWRTWPKRERHSVEAYFMALWRLALTSFDAGPLDRWLAEIRYLEADLTPFILVWQDSPSLPALYHLAEFIGEELDALLESEWWTEQPGARGQMLACLRDPETLQRLEQAATQYEVVPYISEYVQDVFTRAIDQLRQLQQAAG